MNRIPILEDFPQCECCGARIYQPGLCAVCAAFKRSVDHVTLVSQRVEIPLARLITWEDLLERP